MTPKMALLVLSWQVACIYHDKENDSLLPGSQSATWAESEVLDEIHDELTPEIAWEEFNEVYGSFPAAKDRTEKCIQALAGESDDFKSKVLECMLNVAAASKEDDNPGNVSPEEMNLIQQVKAALIG
ncbi:MAG: hypothetical protein MJY98_09645 [Fibrobacter sp.]|nr:hypothetical protein [Fibrobacter sp.]